MNELVKSNLYLIHMDDELYHHGIKGMKWGVRRYQNPDGTLTEEGKKRKRKRLIAAGAIVAGAAALTIAAIAGGKAARKLNAGRKFMANENWRNATISSISDAKSPVDISNIRNMNSGKYGLVRTTGVKGQGKMPWSKSTEAPWSKAGHGSPWSRPASPETGKWFTSHKTTVEGIGRNFKQPLATYEGANKGTRRLSKGARRLARDLGLVGVGLSAQGINRKINKKKKKQS